MNIPDYWAQFAHENHTLHIAIGVTHMIIGICGGLVNVFILYFFSKVKRKKNSSSYFMINLTTVNLMVLMVNVPMSSISSFSERWMFGDIGCKFYGIVGGLFGFISIATMVFMSIQRYLIIKEPFYALKIKNKGLNVSIIVIWAYSAIWVLLPLFSRHGYMLEGALTSCSFDYLSRDVYSRTIMISMVVFGFVLPVATVSVFYMLVWNQLKSRNLQLLTKSSTYDDLNQRFRSLRNIPQNSDEYLPSSLHASFIIKNEMLVVSQPRCSSAGNFNSILFKSRDFNLVNTRREIKITKTLILFVLVFLLTWLPYSLMVLYAQFGSSLEKYLTPVTVSVPALFAKVSTIVNPFILIIKSSECRSFIKNLFIKPKTPRAMPSTPL